MLAGSPRLTPPVGRGGKKPERENEDEGKPGREEEEEEERQKKKGKNQVESRVRAEPTAARKLLDLERRFSQVMRLP